MMAFIIMVGSIFTLLPTVTALPAGLSDSVATIFSYITPFSAFIPFDVILTVFSIILVFEAGYLLFKILVFIYKRIPFLG